MTGNEARVLLDALDALEESSTPYWQRYSSTHPLHDEMTYRKTLDDARLEVIKLATEES